jgi:glycosyltransferase involved in cell wall biosynthesis
MTHLGVVLCTHNGARFVEAQIRSILDQDEPIGSIHIHDFGSTDDTCAIVERMASADKDRMSLTRHHDAPGPAASFIAGLRLALAQLPADAWILFVDQDDIWLPHKLSVLRREIVERALRADRPALVFHDVRVVDNVLNTLRPTYYSGNPFSVPRDLTPIRLMMSNPAIGHTMALSKALAERVADWPDPDSYLMHDWLAILIASRIGQVHFIPDALSLYRQHDSNVLGAYRSNRRMLRVKRLMRFIDRQVRQAVCFSRAVADEDRLAAGPAARENPVIRLELACRRGYRSAARALALAAVRHGPTWQRKAIGVLLMGRALVGPLRNGK